MAAKLKSHLWNDPRFRSIVIQVSIVGITIAIIGYFVSNTAANLSRQGIASGFDFLDSTSGFAIVQTLIEYDETSTYGRVFWVGLVNTLAVSGLGILLATLIGFTVGISRLSKNWLVAKLASTYIETLRNIPLLLQIFFWYFVTLRALPHPRNSFEFNESIFINNRGLYTPGLITEAGSSTFLWITFFSIIAAVVFNKWSSKQQLLTGKEQHSGWITAGILFLIPLIAFFATGKPFHLDFPKLTGFNFEGGIVMIPELVSLLTALSFYTATFIAEIVRSGIVAVNKGQIEAAASLGLKPSFTMRLVVIPQALRVIIPPLTSQYLNLTKNSSLAAAIGYPDLVAVFAGTVLNQTGQAVEVISITMMVYLTLSLAISAFMNWYNKRISLAER